MNRFRRIKEALVELGTRHSKALPYVVGALVLLIIYILSKSGEHVTRVYHEENKTDFKDARVLGSNGESIYEGKERLLTKTVRDLQDAQITFKETASKLDARLKELEAAKKPEPTPTPAPNSNPKAESDHGSVHYSSAPEEFEARRVPQMLGVGSPDHSYTRGQSVLSFPVKETASEKTTGIVLPSGSYVKAKLMTGVEAPEGKTYPALLQLDYAYIIPNKKKLDLSGCFMIAKSVGDLSTERVQMQPTKLSCVSHDGHMFERDINGFVADDKDNSFAVIGSVSSKQDRVAAMAFLSSIVEGVGKALQQAQTTQSTNPLGASSTFMTGNQAAYIGAGGASNAAGMVTQWYLHQAQNLLPTVNIGSGHDVWVVMTEKVQLPSDYFRINLKGETDEGAFMYLSRLND